MKGLIVNKTWKMWEIIGDIRKGMEKGFDLKIVTEGYCFMINNQDFVDVDYNDEYISFTHKRDKPDTLVMINVIVGFEWIACPPYQSWSGIK